MYRDILTNRWTLGGCGFLILLSIGCYFWYQHELAPYRNAEAEAQQQWEISQKITETDLSIKQVDDSRVSSMKSTSADGAANVSDVVSENKDNSKSEKAASVDKTDAHVLVSPYGFGPYPEVPSDFPGIISWNDPEGQANLPDHANKNIELIERVLIKLWKQGDKNFRGGSTYNGKVYPHYHNTVYVLYNEYKLLDGTTQRYPAYVKSGPQVIYSSEDLLNPPAHLRILNLNSSGIDPYQFLDLP